MAAGADRYFRRRSRAVILLVSKLLSPEDVMSTSEQDRILVVDDNCIFRETLAQRLRASGHEVLVADTGERAFLSLRNWSRSIGWLYTRAALPGLIDGWILADEYHDSYPGRAVVLSVSEARLSRSSDIVLQHPTLATAFECIQFAVNMRQTTAPGSLPGRRRAA
jgi:CheY-like chemotaxis protein